MTIQAALDHIDERKPNMYTVQQKVAWISELDGRVFREVFLAHEGMPKGVTFEGYDQETQMDTTLLVPEPYTDVYLHYMSAQMDISNRETNEYAKDMLLFNSAWESFCGYWTRTHMPISPARQFRF